MGMDDGLEFVVCDRTNRTDPFIGIYQLRKDANFVKDILETFTHDKERFRVYAVVKESNVSANLLLMKKEEEK